MSIPLSEVFPLEVKRWKAAEEQGEEIVGYRDRVEWETRPDGSWLVFHYLVEKPQ